MLTLLGEKTSDANIKWKTTGKMLPVVIHDHIHIMYGNIVSLNPFTISKDNQSFLHFNPNLTIKNMGNQLAIFDPAKGEPTGKGLVYTYLTEDMEEVIVADLRSAPLLSDIKSAPKNHIIRKSDLLITEKAEKILNTSSSHSDTPSVIDIRVDGDLVFINDVYIFQPVRFYD